MTRATTTLWLSLLLATVMPNVGSAQSVGELAAGAETAGTVTGSGTVTLQRTPTLMRLSIQLSEKAESLKDALAQLKDRREAAVLQLETLGVKKDSVQIKAPTLAAGESSQQRQMAQMIQMRRMQGRRIPKGLETPKIVTVTSQLTAEWDLDMEDREALLLFAMELQDNVTEADLGGLKEAKKLSPEAAEAAEEMEAMMNEMSYGSEQIKPGEPQFIYVARLSEADKQEALATAFQRAKTQASQLAQAADSQLGDLVTLTGMTAQGNDSAGGYSRSTYEMRMMMAQLGQQQGADSAQTEAMMPTPSDCSFQVMVQAAFRLK